jgi:hypothetical protein
MIRLILAHCIFAGRIPCSRGFSGQVVCADERFLNLFRAFGVDFLLAARPRYFLVRRTFSSRGGTCRTRGFRACRFCRARRSPARGARCLACRFLSCRRAMRSGSRRSVPLVDWRRLSVCALLACRPCHRNQWQHQEQRSNNPESCVADWMQSHGHQRNPKKNAPSLAAIARALSPSS